MYLKSIIKLNKQTMSTTITLGGKRLGSGNKNTVSLHGYERSTQNMARLWKSTMAPGTLVPFMKEVGLPGDTWEIDLGALVHTHPTIGPLFGSYDIYLDIFMAEMRLYNGLLHQNQTDLGRKMNKVKFPLLEVQGNSLNTDGAEPLENQQINPSCILKYLGMSGLGYNVGSDTSARWFNGIPFLMYWDVYKVFYANKQEEVGAVIHRDPDPVIITWSAATLIGTDTGNKVVDVTIPETYVTYNLNDYTALILESATTLPDVVDYNSIMFTCKDDKGNVVLVPGTEVFSIWKRVTDPKKVQAQFPRFDNSNVPWIGENLIIGLISYQSSIDPAEVQPRVVTFPLENLNTMRDKILMANRSVPLTIEKATNLAPYTLVLDSYIPGEGDPNVYSCTFSQEGLALKTYKSDKFNNWINTEWIDGEGGINEQTAVDTSEGSFTISALILNKKLYDMMMRIGVSGGTADDWQEVVYDHKPRGNDEEPIYMGGLVKSIVFDEVVSNSQSADQPLGTLAGRGVMGKKHKGGKIVIKVDRPSYIMGIVSIVPNIDYYQGNDWDVNLKTIDDLHKPALDQIGFQDLITEEMAWWSSSDGSTPTFRSAGKVPAWLDYQTTVSKVYGNFADESQQMFMVLTRRYEAEYVDEDQELQIKDLTTYIDPSKFNYIFADTRIDAMNFWVQIAADCKVRRKMSANVMPNL